MSIIPRYHLFSAVSLLHLMRDNGRKPAKASFITLAAHERHSVITPEGDFQLVVPFLCLAGQLALTYSSQSALVTKDITTLIFHRQRLVF